MIKLSICIATYNRERYIGETLYSILSQMQPSVELVVVDGASPDDTQAVMMRYLVSHPEIRYYREQENSGIDGDYDKAVGYARGEYCWLMTDDDLLHSGAIAEVLAVINDGDPDLVIVNSEVRNANCSEVLNKHLLTISDDKQYSSHENELFFSEVARYLSYIGAVVIRRNIWLSRNRSHYYGTLFVHVGVIFQHPPISRVKVIAEPQIIIRYGNAMWTARGFEIWMFKWPMLIWSFPDFSEASKQLVCRREPWRSAGTLLHQRALGAYSESEFNRFIPSNVGVLMRMMAYVVSRLPASCVNMVALSYCMLKRKKNGVELFDLLHNRHANGLSRRLAGIFLKGIA